MMTSERFAEPILEQSIYSQADLLASPRVRRGSNLAQLMTVGSGRKCSALLTKPGPVGSLLRTLLESSRWASTLCLLTWKPKTTKSGRLYFRLAVSERGMSGSESGLWPTPTVDGDYNRNGASKNSGDGLATFVKRLMPTPMARDHRAASPGDFNRKTPGLPAVIQLMPTPTANSHTGPGKRGEGGLNLQTVINGPVNPAWEEWYMGYPIGWTELEPLEMP